MRVAFKTDRAAPTTKRALTVLNWPNPGPSRRGSTWHHSLLMCPREHALAYEVGLEPDAMAEPLRDGLLFHGAMEAYYRAALERQQSMLAHWARAELETGPLFFEKQHEWQRAAIQAVAPLSEDPECADQWELMSRMLDSYFEKYFNLDRFEVLAVEETIEWWAKDVGHIDYTARLDTVILDHRRESFGVWILEHKSCRSITPELVANYQMDLQILGQVWLFLRCIDHTKLPAPFRGVRINLVSKAKRPQMERVDVCPSPHHLAAFERAIVAAQQLRPHYEALGWPQWLGHCAGYARGYSTCPFYAVCHNFPNVSVEEWKQQEPPMGYHRKHGVAA